MLAVNQIEGIVINISCRSEAVLTLEVLNGEFGIQPEEHVVSDRIYRHTELFAEAVFHIEYISAERAHSEMTAVRTVISVDFHIAVGVVGRP